MKSLSSWFIMFSIGAIVSCVSCRKPEEVPPIVVEEQVYEANYSRFDVEESAEFGFADSNEVGYFIAEASGIVGSRKNIDLVYVHEDSGNRSVVYVYSSTGEFRGEMILIGIQNRDWEDIAIGPGPVDGESYIYVGDFGDNDQKREELRIHRFIEPDFTGLQIPFEVEVDFVETILYAYPDGPRDTETLLINPIDKSLILVTKRDPQVRVYELSYPQDLNKISSPKFKGALPFKTVVGGDISADGQSVLIKTYGEVYYWDIQSDNLIKSLFENKPKKVAYIPEVQGESIGWDASGNNYYTISETDNGRAKPILYRYTRN